MGLETKPLRWQNRSIPVSEQFQCQLGKLKVKTLVDVEGEHIDVLKRHNLFNCQIVGFFFGFISIFIKSTKWIKEKFGLVMNGQPLRMVQPGNLHLKSPWQRGKCEVFIFAKAMPHPVSLKIKVELCPAVPVQCCGRCMKSSSVLTATALLHVSRD